MLIRMIPLVIAAVSSLLMVFNYLAVPEFSLFNYIVTALLAYIVVAEVRLFVANGGFTRRVKGVFL